jgi:hypothetical protein
VSKITVALDILGDGKWHRIDELLACLRLSEDKFRELASFFNAYGFVKVDEKHGKVKINSDFKKLLAQAVT